MVRTPRVVRVSMAFNLLIDIFDIILKASQLWIVRLKQRPVRVSVFRKPQTGANK